MIQAYLTLCVYVAVQLHGCRIGLLGIFRARLDLPRFRLKFDNTIKQTKYYNLIIRLSTNES